MIVGPISGALGLTKEIWSWPPGEVDLGSYLINPYFAVALLALLLAQYGIYREVRPPLESASLAFKTLEMRVFVDQNDPSSKSGIQLGVVLQNFGPALIRYRVESMTVSVNGSTVANPIFQNPGADVPPQEGSTYWFPVIPGLDATRNLAGEIEFVLLYGSPGARIVRQMRRRLTVHLARPEGSDRIGTVFWTGVEESDERVREEKL